MRCTIFLPVFGRFSIPNRRAVVPFLAFLDLERPLLILLHSSINFLGGLFFIFHQDSNISFPAIYFRPLGVDNQTISIHLSLLYSFKDGSANHLNQGFPIFSVPWVRLQVVIVSGAIGYLTHITFWSNQWLFFITFGLTNL